MCLCRADKSRKMGLEEPSYSRFLLDINVRISKNVETIMQAVDCTEVQLPRITFNQAMRTEKPGKSRLYLMHLPCANLYFVAGGEQDVHTVEMLQI